MIKRIGVLLIYIVILTGIASASSEAVLKAGFILNKDDEESYSWIIIHETSYFIKDLISIGYETQISYYKVKSYYYDVEFENNAYPINVFFNSKVKILRNGIIRPYAGAGFGLLTNIIKYPQEFVFEKFNAFHIMAGINISKNTQTAFQIELRLLNYNKKDSHTKFLLAAGFKY